MLTLDAQSLSYDDSTQSLFCAWPPARVSSTTEPLCRPARMRKYPKQTRSIILVTSIKQAAMMVAKRTTMEDIQASKICEVAGVAMGVLVSILFERRLNFYRDLRRHDQRDLKPRDPSRYGVSAPLGLTCSSQSTR